MLKFTHEQPDGSFITFARTGECCQCGECCKTGDPFQGEMGKPEISGGSPLLRLLSDGLHICADRENPYYLNGCNVFPTHPSHLLDHPGCSYKFERVA